MLHKQKLINRVTTSVIALMGTSIINMPTPSYAESIASGPPPTISGCYNVGDEQVKFIYQKVDTLDPNVLNRLANSIPNVCNGSYAWDDKWYWESLPDNRNKYIFLMWKNIKNGEYGWLVIQNTPSTWNWYTNDGRRGIVPNGEQAKRTWWTNGYRIDIDVRNPPNQGPWTANDIWYGFGY